MKEKFFVSYSGGKDSMLALDRMVNDGHELVGIFTTTNADIGSWFHDIKLNIINEVAKSLNTVFEKASVRANDQYTSDFENVLKDLKTKYQITSIVFGDIDIIDHQKWCQDRCNAVGLKAIFPLWNEDRVALVNEFIDKGYQAIIKRVDKTKMSKDFLGQVLSHELVNKFSEIKIDECGENGEYHTLVIDGPLFNYAIPIEILDIEETEGSYNLNVSLKQL